VRELSFLGQSQMIGDYICRLQAPTSFSPPHSQNTYFSYLSTHSLQLYSTVKVSQLPNHFPGLVKDSDYLISVDNTLSSISSGRINPGAKHGVIGGTNTIGFDF
jgi:hypothetical protein